MELDSKVQRLDSGIRDAFGLCHAQVRDSYSTVIDQMRLQLNGEIAQLRTNEHLLMDNYNMMEEAMNQTSTMMQTVAGECVRRCDQLETARQTQEWWNTQQHVV